MIGAVLVRLATNLAIPGWASYTVGILLVLFVQAVMAAFVFSFVILGVRHGTTFLPRRDYSYLHRFDLDVARPRRNPCRRCRFRNNSARSSFQEGEKMSYVYVGTELDLFAAAEQWKSYVQRQVAPYLGRQVLEVGAGHGGTTRVLCGDGPKRWVCLEPDSSLADRLIAAISAGELPDCCEARIGTLADLDDSDRSTRFSIWTFSSTSPTIAPSSLALPINYDQVGTWSSSLRPTMAVHSV